ncbi:hypothetical protein ACHWQZ_G019013 [Mnemiopsis leidyi]
MENTVLRAKLIVLGDASVGKSSLVQVFHSDSQQGFPKAYSMTSDVQLQVKSVKIPDSPYTVELYVYDCAGQETFQPFISKILGSSALVLLVSDLTNQSSLSAAVKWFERARNANKDFKMQGALVGNKCDLDLRRAIKASEAEETAANLGIPYFECSAKEGVQVDEPFYFLANCLYEQYIEQTQEFQNIADTV